MSCSNPRWRLLAALLLLSLVPASDGAGSVGVPNAPGAGSPNARTS